VPESGYDNPSANKRRERVAAMEVPSRRPKRRHQVRADKPRHRRLHRRQSEDSFHVAKCITESDIKRPHPADGAHSRPSGLTTPYIIMLSFKKLISGAPRADL
jgi:hypothetical protein